MGDQDFTLEWLARANRLATVAAVLSTTVHEANNALQIISGSAEMLSAGASPAVIGRRGEAIGSQARRASALLAELSAFARDEGAEAATRVDLAQIAQRALTMRQYTLARLNVQGAFEASGPIAAAARPRPILQIVLNLLLNSERALDGVSGGRIRLAAQQRDQCAQLIVDDNGPGLSDEARRHLFEARVGRSVDSLGIGLAVAKWLAEREGGTLSSAPSALGGCAFTLSLRCS